MKEKRNCKHCDGVGAHPYQSGVDEYGDAEIDFDICTYCEGKGLELADKESQDQLSE